MKVQIPDQDAIIGHLIGDQRRTTSSNLISVFSPYHGKPIAQVTEATPADVDDAVTTAKAASESWKRTPLKERTRILFQFRELTLRHIDELSHLAAAESGKTFGEAKAGLLKGLEVTEFALSLQNMDDGGSLDVSRGVSCEYRREPLGVVAGIVPFNFPAMVPMWMFPIAVTLGNCFVMKPSEKVPLTLSRMGELMLEAGFPPGVFNLLQGGREAAEGLIDHPDVAAVAFVGSTDVAKAVYRRATQQGKRALCLGGAKNNLIVVPDAEPEMTIDGVVKSFTGCAGQRCMAASLMLAVGDVQTLIDGIVTKAKSLRLGEEMGAIIDPQAMERIHNAISQAEKDGCDIILDGRNADAPPGYEGGYWVGPTIIDQASPDHSCATDEIFGPVLTIVRVNNLHEAMLIEQRNKYGNATAIFTTTGAAARVVTEQATAGMIGVNVGVPVPREPFSFGGTKDSKFGHGDITGESSLDFWTNRKKITIKWEMQKDLNWMA